jgi:hypothetical protein
MREWFVRRCGRAKGWFLALLVGMSLPAGMTVAPPSWAAGRDEELAAGLKKFEEGRKAFEAGQFEAALAAFTASLELLPSPNTRLYIGRCYRALGRTASAYTALRLAASEAQDRLIASHEKRYSATRDTANTEASELDAQVPRLTVAVPASPPPGFVVKVDGKELPSAAWGVATETDPGDVVIEASGPRLEPFQKKVTLAAGARERVDVPMTRVPTATIAVKLKMLPSGLSLTLDGQPLEAQGAETPRDVDIGSHTLVASAPGYLTFTMTRPLANNEAEVVEVTLTPDPHAGGGASAGTPKWLFFTVAGLAVASLGAGAGIALHAQGQQNQQLGLDPFARDPAVKSSIQSQATLTDILFTGGGLLGAGAVVLAFTTRWGSAETAPAPSQAVTLLPWLGPSGAGVGAHGSF